MKKAILAVSVVVFLAIVMTFSSCTTPLGEQLLMLYEESEESPSSQEIPWDQTAGEWWDQIGRQVTLTFSPGGDPLPVWGTDVYTSDSSIGTAAVHAGLITFSSGGTVTIEIVPGDESYLGTDRNGVSTVSYGAWDSGFVFIDNNGNRIYSAPVPAYKPVQADDPGEAAEFEEPAVQEGPAEDITWGFTVSGMETEPGQVLTFRLPPDGSEYSVWGTDVYTDDSCIGTAAVHAGLITFSSGGRVTIQIREGAESYLGTFRNGVTSTDYGAWGGSFVFIDD